MGLKVLYLTNIPNPYREKFFEQLGQRCELTVLYEHKCSHNRDSSWAAAGTGEGSYHRVFLEGVSIGREGAFSLSVNKWLGGGRLVVVGCFNSPTQIEAIGMMRAKRIPYVINLDGPLFETSSVRRCIRNCVLRGADGYLVAGERSAASLHGLTGAAPVVAYPFSSMTTEEVAACATPERSRNSSSVLCVGQFLPCKGLDVCIEAARQLPSLRFKLIGSGKRSAELQQRVAMADVANVEVIPFLLPQELRREYLSAGLFVLPSRQECWGLVVNEAAACGTPIVSTWGSGAAVEFLSGGYPALLAEPDNADSLVLAIRECLKMDAGERNAYSAYLREKARAYTIEAMVDAHIRLFNDVAGAANEKAHRRA